MGNVSKIADFNKISIFYTISIFCTISPLLLQKLISCIWALCKVWVILALTQTCCVRNKIARFRFVFDSTDC
jgi:hypothetical protein